MNRTVRSTYIIARFIKKAAMRTSPFYVLMLYVHTYQLMFACMYLYVSIDDCSSKYMSVGNYLVNPDIEM